jgi:hypothetical protein
MHYRYIAFLCVVAAISSAFVSPAAPDTLERDRCSCKLAMKGAESTLKGGVCIRTEASTCLMEWNAGSVGPTTIGSGLSQRDAAIRTETDFSKLPDGKFEIPRLGDSRLPEKPTQLDIAVQNLALVPPDDYFRVPGIPESFLLAAGSALARFSNSPMTFIAVSLLRNRRDEFLNLLSKGGETKVEQYRVRGNPGCLIIEDQTQHFLVYVKTPFAISEQC